jgi:hypothetical protein
MNVMLGPESTIGHDPNRYGVDPILTGTLTAVNQTVAEKANTLFAQLVKNVPGVVHVEPFGGEVIGEQSFRVYVRDGDLDAETGVYQAKGQVYDRYPNAALCVEVLEQSDLPASSDSGRAVAR